MRADLVEDIYPLAPMQEGILFHHLLSPQAGDYFRQVHCRLGGPLDVAALTGAWREAVGRLPVLRTAFLTEGVDRPVQVVLREAELPVVQEDLTGGDEPSQEARVEAFLAADRQRDFALDRPPLMRLALLATGSQEHRLVWSYHHLILDGWSISLLLRDVFAAYRALVAGSPPGWPRRRPYRDYVAWLQRRDLGAAEAYWRRTLAGFAAPTPLAGSQRTPGDAAGAEESLALSPAETVALEDLARSHRLTLNTVLQGAWALLLARYSGETDVCFGTTVSGRPTELPGFEEMVGLFVNTLPVRVAVPSATPLLTWLAELQESQVEAREHEHAPLVRVQGWSEVPRGAPLFESLTAFENFPPVGEAAGDGPALSISDVRFPDATNYPLTLIGTPGTRLELRLLYRRDRFAATEVQQRLRHLARLLVGMTENPGARLGDLPLLAEEERRELLHRWNPDAAEPAPPGLPLHERFRRQAAERPDAVAVVDGIARLTYGELDRRSERVARGLRHRGVGLEERVALDGERSAELLVGLLGILKAGAAYLPLDPAYPHERRSLMLDDAAVRFGLAIGGGAAKGAAADPAAERVQWLSLADLDEYTESGGGAPELPPEAAAYVIYTSGSTGRPKGVVVSHHNAGRLFDVTGAGFGFGPADAWTFFHSSAFDFSVWEIWGALLHGGRVVVVPHWTSRSPEELLALLAREAVTVLNQTPTAFRSLMAADEAAGGVGTALRWVIFGGEALDPASLDPWFRRHGERQPRLVNMYGITETTVHVTLRPLSRDDARPGAASVLGQPLGDLRLYLTAPEGAAGEPVPLGVAGELRVGGEGLARGYLGRPALTAERFVPDPFGDAPGARLYRSGDVARRRPDGDLEYLGRLDHQVKIRGFRIELGEIEAVLASHPDVERAVVVARPVGEGQQLVGYLVPRAGCSVEVGEVRDLGLSRLPDYMVPAAIVLLESLPLTEHGKLHRAALPDPDAARGERVHVAPATLTQKVLARVWEAVLGVERVGVTDNFFSLGGDSIRSIQVRSRAEQQGVTLSLQQLFAHPVLGELAAVLDRTEGDAPAPETGSSEPFALVDEAVRDALLVGEVEDAYPLSRLQAGMVFHSELDPEGAVYHDIFTYRLEAPFDGAALEAAVGELLAVHPVLRTSIELSRFGEPLQLVHRRVANPLAMEDLGGQPEAAQDAAVKRWVEEERRRSFAWAQAPLLRFQVHRRGDADFQFSLAFHHAILDGWSVASMLTELFQRYRALVDGGGAPPVAPRATFRDFVAEERRLLASAEAEAFWSDQLAAARPTVLPRWPRGGSPARREAHRVPVAVSEELSARLAERARQWGVPVKSVLLAAHLRVVSMVTTRPEVTVGLVSHGRPGTGDGERVLGLFLNTPPLTVALGGGKPQSWSELVRRVFEAERAMVPYRTYPLAELVRRREGQGLFETVFNFVHFHVYEGLQQAGGLRVVDGDSYEETNHPLTATFRLDGAGRLSLHLLYRADELPREQVEALGRYHQRALEALADAPETPVEATDLRGDEERDLERAWNLTGRTYPQEEAGELPLHALVASQAERTPDAVAVVAGELHLSHGELGRRARSLAARLAAAGVGRGQPVGLLATPSAAAVVGILGIATAGGAWLPLDPFLPPERLAGMAADAGVAALVVSDAGSVTGDDGTLLTDVPRVPVVAAETPAAIAGAAVAAPTVDATDLAYVLYTSGSTGRPKGVMVPHRAIANRVLWMISELAPGGDDAVLLKTPLGFDASVWEVFVPLISGGRLVVAPPGAHRDPALLVAEVARRRVTWLQLVPSLLPSLAGAEGVDRLTSLSRLFCGGEPLPVERIARLRERLPVAVVNLYGPTEVAIDATFHVMADGSAAEAEAADARLGIAPIGRSLANLRVHVLDAALRPVPVGSPGELCVAGRSLAWGYVGRPGATAEVFVPDPLAPEPGGRLYRTGDLVRRRPSGLLDFLGRLDRQVKLRGVRIEPGEVEVTLEEHPDVLEAAVEVRDGGAGPRLVAWVVARPGRAAPAPESLRAHLARRLPDAMVPAAYAVLPDLPRTSSGKLDRRALPAPEVPERSERRRVEPRNPLERAVAAIWAEVLGVERVGAEDDFFELGGHSLLALQVMARLRSTFDVEVPLRALFEEPTVALLALAVAEQVTRRIEELSDEESARLLARMEALS